MRKVVFGLSAIALVLSGCAKSGAEDSQKRVDELEEQVNELKSQATSTTGESVATTAPAATTAAPTTEAPTTAPPTTAPPTTAPAASLMPDVVCMNLQDAQDYIQETTDVFLSLSEDATGEGRNQIIDANWIVVGQRPEPGTPIGEGDAVLSVVKLEEPNDC